MGFLDRFGKDKGVELAVRTDKPAYLPGETVTATIAVIGKKDTDIEEGRAALVYENEYTYRETSRDFDDDLETEDETATDSVTYGDERFRDAGSVRAGARDEYAVVFRLPSDAVPSGEGAITSVRWKVKAVLRRRRARDADGEATLSVFSPPEAYASRAERAPEADRDSDCDLELHVASAKSVRAGDAVVGTFVVTPRSALEAEEVRIELVRREEVHRGDGKEDETVVARTATSDPDLSTPAPREYPFELTVVDGAPSLETEKSSVRWYVRGVVARRMRSDYNIRQELNVYTAPAS